MGIFKKGTIQPDFEPAHPDELDTYHGKPKLDEKIARTVLARAQITDAVAIIGVRGFVGPENKRGVFDDVICVVGPNFFDTFNANTDPAVFRPRIAVLKTGIWNYKIGIHGLSKPANQRYKALVQAGPVTVIRDQVGSDTGWFGINIHRGGTTSVSSIGCQTIKKDQWERFITVVEQLMNANAQKVVKYCLIEGRDLLPLQIEEPKKEEPKVEEPEHEDKDVGEYGKLFASMYIRPEWQSKAEYAAKLIVSSKTRYETVEKETRTPWFIIGLIHLMESNCDFKTHLHNGDPLTARTRQVPRGRPTKGEPPFTWEESAIDALYYDRVLPPLNTIDEQLYALEKMNGFGYRKRGIHSPYLWSGSNHYTKGKFVRDGVYDANAVSKQVGAAVVLKILKEQHRV